MVESIILFSKTIKPSSPTPSSLRHHKFSVLDHFGTPAYAPIAAFYSKPTDHNHNISQILENSFSKVLASYYPFAGRLIDENSYVDCNDTGVEYLNVRINCPMNGVLNNPYNDTIDVVFPRNLPWNRSFKELDFKPSTKFDSASFFPILSIDDIPHPPDFVSEPQRCVSKRYNFSSSDLERLKDSVSSVVQNPTRVEVATALLHRCISIANFSKFKPTLMSHVMNLRPPLINTVGNACAFFSYVAETEDDCVRLNNYFETS
ncbi:hypothetical protein FXO38_21048 [Capsicum annuum]|nr:hypothetical protein FXO38_21048 [Capsicum annuum]KAF3645348.1 hypothetical protein FXO37_21040 [Capsicum annuum]